jgi:hypothetical protein
MFPEIFHPWIVKWCPFIRSLNLLDHLVLGLAVTYTVDMTVGKMHEM